MPGTCNNTFCALPQLLFGALLYLHPTHSEAAVSHYLTAAFSHN